MNRRLSCAGGCAAVAVMLLAGCTAGSRPSASTTPDPLVSASPHPASPTPAASRTRTEWPFEMTACPGSSAEPWLIVALGTSETAGWGLRTDEAYSPQDAYPAVYARRLCQQEGVTVELHSYFPSQRSNTLAPLAWWIDKVNSDEALRADLSSARTVMLWAMSSHDVVRALYLGGCSGAWPDPQRACLEAAMADVPAETDQLFGTIAGLIGTESTVLAADAYAPPMVVADCADESLCEFGKSHIDPRASVMPMAAKYGFTFVDTEAALNGPSLREPIDPAFMQSDGLHLTLAGQRAVAEVFAEADGIGD